MSLWSTFYIGDAERISRLLTAHDYRALESDPTITAADFSGGIGRPVLFPHDFGRLVDPEPGKHPEAETAFRTLIERQIIGGDGPEDEEGAYVLSQAGVTRLVSLPESAIEAFNKYWNDECMQSHQRLLAQKCLPRKKPRSVLLMIVDAFDACLRAVVFSLFRGIGFMIGVRRHQNPQAIPNPPLEVDWKPRLKALQDQLRSAVSQGKKVVYHWSL